MLILYRIYQIFVMCPLIVVATIITAVVTVVGSALGFGRWWGYYPEILWSRLFCWLAFVRVTVRGRENIDPKVSYVFVANHQSAHATFTVYGYLGHNFRWMMKQSLRKIPFVGWACRWAGQIFVDNSSASATRHTMEHAERRVERWDVDSSSFPRELAPGTARCVPSSAGPTAWLSSLTSLWCR